MKTLVKWSGGKEREIGLFQEYIPTDFKTYIEPFAGGASLFFHLEHPANIIADVHTELTTFYSQMKQGKAQDIYDLMKKYPNTEETYYIVRDKLVIDTDLLKAFRFYYLRKTCFRGMMRYNKQGGFNIPFGRYKTCNFENLKDPNYKKIFDTTQIFNKPFDWIFEQFDSPDNFVFLDPPYDSKFTDYGYCKFGSEEHRRLAECFKKTKNKCLMIIGKTPLIDELYGDYVVGQYDKKYAFKIHSGRVGSEINTVHYIIKNY